MVQPGQEEIKGDLILKSDLTEALHCVKGAGKNDGERTFTRKCTGRSRGDGLDLDWLLGRDFSL